MYFGHLHHSDSDTKNNLCNHLFHRDFFLYNYHNTLLKNLQIKIEKKPLLFLNSYLPSKINGKGQKLLCWAVESDL